MSPRRESSPSGAGGSADREDRLARKLRENLARRKQQRRGRDSAGESGGDAPRDSRDPADAPDGGTRRKPGDPGP